MDVSYEHSDWIGLGLEKLMHIELCVTQK